MLPIPILLPGYLTKFKPHLHFIIADDVNTGTIHVSLTGSENPSCGSAQSPCRYVKLALQKSNENDKVLIDGSFWDRPATFYEDNIHISKTVQIVGYNGRPILSPKGTGTFITVQSDKTALENNASRVVFNNVKLTVKDHGTSIVYVNDASVFASNTEFNGGKVSLHIDCRILCQVKLEDLYFVGVDVGILISDNFNVSINNSFFKGIWAVSHHAIMIARDTSNSRDLTGNIEIDSSTFQHFGSALTVKIATGGEMKFRVVNCSFIQNFAPLLKNGAAISISVSNPSFNATTISITRSSFLNNFGSYGGAIYLSCLALLLFNITYCSFETNFAAYAGGAIYTKVSNSVYISESLFIENEGSTDQSVGGAVVLSGNKDATYKTVFRKCFFKDNKAPAMGGTIYSLLRSSTIELVDVIFESCTEYDRRATDGDIAFLLSKVKMWNTTVRISNPINERIVFYIHNDDIEIDKKSSIICAVGYRTVITKILRFHEKKSGFSLFSMLCRTCPYNHYSLTKSSFHDLKIKNPTCFPCPSNSVCRLGISRPKDNFWGYQVNSSGPLSYIRLPMGYGCTGGKCKRFNSCAPNREGVMCARCSKGYSEHVLVPECISNKYCNRTKFWLLAAAVVIVYTLLFLYKSELFLVCKRHFKWLCSLKCKTEEAENENMVEDVYVKAEDDDIPRDDSVHTRQSPPARTARHLDFGSGLLKIVFYFYQIEIILHETVASIDNTILTQLLQLTRSFFNFNFAAPHKSHLCAFMNITPVRIALLRIGLIAIVFLGLGIIILISRSLEKLPKENIASFMRGLGNRALSASFEIFVLVYAINVLTGLKLLQCASYKHEKRLLIQGDIHCFKPWQYLIMSVMILWALPYCIFIFFLPKWLMKKDTNKTGIFLGCLFPLPFLMKKLHKWRSHTPFDGISSEQDDPVIIKILESLVAPFKKFDGSREVLSWEAVFIFRRLLLIILVRFVQDPIAKIQFMLFAQVVFLLHHMHYKPFNRRFLNHLETASLTTLVLFTSASAVHVYDFKYGITEQDASTVLVILLWLRVSAIIALPCIAAAVLVVPLILWLLRSIAKFVLMFAAYIIRCF